MFLIRHNQLFPIENLSGHESKTIFMVEDLEYFSQFRFHKQKIVFELSAMRAYAESLQNKGFKVHYEKLPKTSDEPPFADRLLHFIQANAIKKLNAFEIEDLSFEKWLTTFCKRHKVKLEFQTSPMFLAKRKLFVDYLKNLEISKGRPMMRTFYQAIRRKHKILIDKKGEPAGGQFTFENLQGLRLPRETRPMEPPKAERTPLVDEVISIVDKGFAKNPGTTKEFWWPTTREQALAWMNAFLSHRLERYGDYEDALPMHSDIAYHSALSPLLNIGLVTPTELIQKSLENAEKNSIPLQSLEAFIRQILGWREYMRGIYQDFGDELPSSNSWKHTKKLKACWRDGTTGIPFLDETIKKALRLGYNHPVERLMIVSNIMLLCEVDPREVFEWFMEFHIDSAEWVTSPNVFGLGQFSDGGLVATRPYICGSAYIKRLGHFAEGPWWDIVDGLYWSFIEKNSKVFAANPRVAVVLPALRKLDANHKAKIFSDAAKFRERVTAA